MTRRRESRCFESTTAVSWHDIFCRGRMIGRIFNCSNGTAVELHSGKLAHRSIGTAVQWHSSPMAHRSNGTAVEWHISPMAHRSNGTAVKWYIGQMAQRSNGTEVESLSFCWIFNSWLQIARYVVLIDCNFEAGLSYRLNFFFFTHQNPPGWKLEDSSNLKFDKSDGSHFFPQF